MSEPIGNTKQLAEPVACRYDFDGYGYIYMDAGSGSDWASRVKDCEFLYTSPQKYCPSENNEAYEKGFIDGMAKQRDSAVQRFVEGGTPDSELAEHKRIIREQQAKIEALKLRELTDEEMLEVYKKVFNKQNEFKENLKRRSYFDFARSILKKASEK